MSDAAQGKLRLLAHTDFEYHPRDGEVFGEHAFTLFFASLAPHLGSLTVLGRVDSSGERARYPLGGAIEFVGLPYYESLTALRGSLPAMASALRRYWRALDDVDAVWLLGPHPLQIGFGLIARLRRREVALGVRQDTPSYVASRHPDRPGLKLAARVLDWLWRQAARRAPVVVVGPAIAERYAHAPRLLEITASLVSEDELGRTDAAPARSYDGEIDVLSVGRVETEKNPLLLADLLARLRSREPRWRLRVAGEGPMLGELEGRLRELGVHESARLLGYVPFGDALMGIYRDSHVLAHVSWTEGFPQVLIEAFAAGLPVVATDVGGIRAAVEDCCLLVPAGDAGALERAIRRVVEEPELRARLVAAGREYAATRTIEAQSAAVGLFLGRSLDPRG